MTNGADVTIARASNRRVRRLGLRPRATLGFGLIGLLVAVALSAITYVLARSYLVDQRHETAARQAFVNARLTRTVLRAPEADIRALLSALGGGTASTTLLRHHGAWFSASVASGPSAVPEDLLRTVTGGQAASQRYRDADGRLHLALGVPIPAVDASYFELFSLAELEATLALLRRSLTIGVAGAAATAAVTGWFMARRVLQPIGPLADAAERVAAGALDTRLTPESDPDLRRLGEAFNKMASSLEARIDREARFAADVSHEVRSPLAAVAAALEVIDRRRAQLPEEVAAAFEVLAGKVSSFQRMVLDLLEISRADAGNTELDSDQIELEPFLRWVVEAHGQPDIPIQTDHDAPARLRADRRRLAQVFGNIVDNAQRYGEGLTRVSVTGRDGAVRIAFDDRGPGVAPEERELIFGRFARGQSGLRSGATTGSGLGLALVAEHLRLHRGSVWVDDAPEGGARFVIELPSQPW